MADEQHAQDAGQPADAVVIPFPRQRDVFDAYAEVHGLLLESTRNS